jgi:hypothetical protein
VPVTDQPWTPDETQLEGNLSLLRNLINQPVPRLADVPELMRVVELLCPSLNGLDGIRAVVQLAIDHLPRDDWTDIAALLYGLTEQSHGQPLQTRRKLAYHTYLERADLEPENFSKETFRTGREPRIIKDLTAALVELVADFYERPPAIINATSTASSTAEPVAASTPATAQPDAASKPAAPAPQPPAIETETGTQPPERRDRRGAHLIKWLMPGYSAIITYAVALLVMALAVILPTGGGASTISGSCGPTTAQLVPQENLDPWAHLYMYAPHQEGAQHGWSGELAYFLNEPKHKEIFHPGETRLVALSYINEEPDMPVVAKVGLSGGASIVPNTTCLYRDADYSKGTRYAKNPLTQAKGLKIEHLASQARVYITFREQLPTSAPEASIVDTYGWIGPENRHEDEWTHGQARIYLKLTR